MWCDDLEKSELSILYRPLHMRQSWPVRTLHGSRFVMTKADEILECGRSAAGSRFRPNHAEMMCWHSGKLETAVGGRHVARQRCCESTSGGAMIARRWTDGKACI